MAKVIRSVDVDKNHDLIRKEVAIDGHSLIALIDCGANHNLIRPGIITRQGVEHVGSVESFDGQVRHDVKLREVSAPMIMDGNVYSGTFTEYDLLDVILGKPWFTRYNPTINWRTHEIKVAYWLRAPEIRDGFRHVQITKKAQDVFEFPLAEEYQLYHVKITAFNEKGICSAEIKDLLAEFDDVFPDGLPTGLPPERRVEFELNMKPDARPSSRAPF